MDSKELRIGNLVKVGFKDESVRDIHIITAPDLLDLDANGTESVFSYEPIPLTEEWLVKFGFFEADKDNSYKKWFSKEINPITYDYNMVLSYSGSHYFYLNGHFVLKYVHQLQNLYFALTQKELIND